MPDTIGIEAVDPETLLAELVGQAVDVWANAHGLGRGSAQLYRRIREVVTPLIADRPLADDLRRLRSGIVRAAAR